MSLPIGGFMPIPLAMMIPFMAVQSLVMGEAFGKAFQFGKRRISAMTNEEFNKLTLADLISESTTQFKLAIPSIKQSINDSTDLQNRIINEMLLILPKFITGDSQASPEHQANVAKAGITQDSGQSAKWGFMVNDLVSKMSLALTSHLPNIPTAEAYRSSDALANQHQGIIETEGPPDLRTDDPPFNSFDYHLQKQKNLQKDAARLAQTAANRQYQQNIVTPRQQQKTAIATGGKSPAAAAAVASFKAKIDDFVKRVKTLSAKEQDVLRLSRMQVKFGKKVEDLPYYQRYYLPVKADLARHVKQLGSLRTKFRNTYGYYY